ncbi:hypothetical protein PMG71_16890 [Roseofilum sp. BLCC_M154]|uniref:Uncharacterized protein n=1 Tax=Roseofilum acuticapitatum BLCC-M154 TaxID=3022444 RepID=A0ABT7AW17_9CYAN|nr:hypothetical protein [Roseofilum acuticapitatum]MDJ1171108.1 hypothetical protein [Roseofilum acuticapitatum BLCC-M154]
MKNLPKQSQPVVRNLNLPSSLLNDGAIHSSDIRHCYKLPGLARSMCMAAY